MQCTQTYNFNTSEKYDDEGNYGHGTEISPYSSSDNFFTAMIKVIFL